MRLKWEGVFPRAANPWITLPIVTDMDFGHTAPQFTLPIGCRARINGTEQEFQIIQSAVE